MNFSAAIIISTYNQPLHLERSLLSFFRQTQTDFEVLIADDGSNEETRAVIEKLSPRSGLSVRHIWHPDKGFRKTRILNRAISAASAEYLIFVDGDCVAHPEFVQEHLRAARHGTFLCGARIRLNARATELISPKHVISGKVFSVGWLTRAGRRYDRRFLRFTLPYRQRCWLNKHSPTSRYFLGSNSSCFRADALAVNGFDHRFTYGYEDADFGYRLENLGREARSVRWTANVLHLDHERPWSIPEELAKNRILETVNRQDGEYLVRDGIAQLCQETDDEVSGAGLNDTVTHTVP